MPKLPPAKKAKQRGAAQSGTAVASTRKPHPAVDAHAMFTLQRTAGNRAVSELLQSNPQSTESPPVWQETANGSVKGAISTAARAVGTGVALLQRVFFKARADGARAPGDAAEIPPQLQAGHPLDADLRRKMERAFEQDFSDVRIHSDEEAARVSDHFNARAFTVGQDVAFAAGEYQPGTPSGDMLIAHELAHVVQQGPGKSQGTQTKDGATYDALEEDADKAAVAAVDTARQGGSGEGTGLTTPLMRSGSQLQRADAAQKYPVLDVSGLPEGVIRDAVTELAQSDAEIERNTAHQLVEGNLHAYYIEDLKTPPGADAKLKSLGADPTVYTILLHPVTGDEIYAQKNFRGFAMGTDIFGAKSDPVAEWKTTLVHETSHAVNPTDRSSQLESYKTEFRAYWVADYANVADLDERARQVKARVLQDYAAINDAYNTDPAIKTAIDSYTRPEGDVKNVTGLKQTTTTMP